MADPQRLPVKYFVIHHAVTPLWPEKSKAELAKWFSDTGFTRGYGGNPSNWSGLINAFSGERSYAQAHLVGQPVTDATPDATAGERALGYRVFPIVQDIWNQIVWGAGNWEVNRQAINIENLGDYRNYTMSEAGCVALANFWRPHDRERGGDTLVVGHTEVSQLGTACPTRIMEKRDHIVELINQNEAPTPPPEKWEIVARLNPPLYFVSATGVQLRNINTGEPVGTPITGTFSVAAKTNIFHGSTWYLTQYSIDKNMPNGFREEDLPWPNVPEPTPPAPIPAPTPTPPTPTPDPPSEANAFINVWYTWLKDWFTKKG